MSEQTDHWQKHALSWARIASPLRPSPEDLVQSQAWIDRVFPSLDGQRRALILGVTPELVLLYWPAETDVYGVDRSIDMVRNAWPAHKLKRTGLGINGDWRRMPLADASISVAIGDGSYSNVETVADYEQLSAEVCRVLRPGGHLIVRLYVRPDEKEAPEAVIAALLAGKAGSFHGFKLRLMMAMADEPHYEVRVADIYRVWAAHGIDYDRLSRDIGIPREIVETMGNYKDGVARYNFPPMSFIREHFSRHFDLVETAHATSYTLAERCPTLLLARL